MNSSSQTSDIPEYYFIFNSQIGFYPKPSTASQTITVDYKKRVTALSVVDYTTGTITATNDSTTITGSGTTFTALMVGRWIKIINGTDDWYRITAYTSATVITIANKYNGATTASLSYIIGEIPLIPEDYQILPLYEAASNYWAIIGENPVRAKFFDTKFKEGLKELMDMYNSSTEDSNLDIDDGEFIRNPNLFPTNIS